MGTEYFFTTPRSAGVRKRGRPIQLLARASARYQWIIGSIVLVYSLFLPGRAGAAVVGETESPSPRTSLTGNEGWAALGVMLALMLGIGVLLIVGRHWLESSPSRRSDETADGEASDRSFVRSWLAVALVGGLLILVVISFWLDDETLRSALVGGVVASAGAAVAFYFASRSSDQARKDILSTALQFGGAKPPVLVEDVMIPVGEILYYPVGPGGDGGGDLKAVPLDSLYDTIKNTEWERLPIFEVDEKRGTKIVRAVVHKRIFEAFAASEDMKLAAALAGKTIAGLDDDAEARIKVFALVAPGSPLDDARRAMGNLPQCTDVFVTDGGAKEGNVRGWLTNSKLAGAAG